MGSITMFTKSCHWTPSISLSVCFFPSGFSNQNVVCTSHFPHMYHTDLILLVITNKLWSPSLSNYRYPLVSSSFLDPNILLST
jgi:hypothetical protein